MDSNEELYILKRVLNIFVEKKKILINEKKYKYKTHSHSDKFEQFMVHEKTRAAIYS